MPVTDPTPLRVVQTTSPESTLKVHHDVVNEQVIITACLVDEAARKPLVQQIPAEWFQGKGHADIWRLIAQFEAQGLHFDPLTVQQLSGGTVDAKYLSKLVENRPASPPNLKHHVDALEWDTVRIEAIRGPFGSLLEAIRDPSATPERYRELARQTSEAFARGPKGKSALDIVTGAELSEALPPTHFAIKHFGITAGRPALLAGYGGSAKSWLAMDLALRIAAGLETAWAVPIQASGAILHLDYEQPRWVTQRRYQRLAHGLEVNLADLGNRIRLANLPAMMLSDSNAEQVLSAACEGIELCIIDSFRAACRDVEENSSQVREYLDRLTRVSDRTGTIFLVVTHANKESKATRGRPTGQRVRGSSSIFDAAGVVLSVSSDGAHVQIEQVKSSMGRAGTPIELSLIDVGSNDPITDETPGIELAPRGTSTIDAMFEASTVEPAEASILEVLRQADKPMCQIDLIVTAKGASKETKRGLLSKLVRSGKIVEEKGERGKLLYSLRGDS